MSSTFVRQGKVRDIYDLGSHYLMVATDRISAFDWILPTEIPDKGRILTLISQFWFDFLGVPNHLVSTDVAEIAVPEGLTRTWLEGRSMIVRKCRVVPIECVVRGYLVGSGWKDYQATGQVSGISLPTGLRNCEQFPQPLFTPATKAVTGHDENISFAEMSETVGVDVAQTLRDRSIDIYRRAAEHARARGIILADTKFEFGWRGDELLLIDEVLTPDSSRFWPADQYQPGRNQPSFDKQFVREYLESTTWDKNSEPPPLPAEIVSRTRQKYIEAYERLTGSRFGF
jgi:phosphoribosylaminoimidazole-succinocarboxamide synthase